MTEQKKEAATQPTKKPLIDPRKCQMHRMWMKKGQCELCRMEHDKLMRQYEQEGGSNKPPVKIGKL